MRSLIGLGICGCPRRRRKNGSPAPDCTASLQKLVNTGLAIGCAVRIPASLQSDDNEVTDPDAIETICYGAILNDPLVEQFYLSQSPDAAFTYFGSWTGVMRIFPGASYSNECGDYDPRVSPW